MKKRVRERRDRRRRVDIDRSKQVDFQRGFLEGFLWECCEKGGKDVGIVFGLGDIS